LPRAGERVKMRRMAVAAKDLLETFANPNPQRSYLIRHVAPEFTSRCPKTGQPDFGTVIVEYVPERLCIELKSLKFYFQAYREQGIFYEAVTNRILDDLVATLQPRSMKVVTQWHPRGGLTSTITAEYRADGAAAQRRDGGTV
jgi:7-cyano-7-deazaguanine reductase